MELLQELLTRSLHCDASDVHIVPGLPPLFRIHTVLQPLEGYETISAE